MIPPTPTMFPTVPPLDMPFQMPSYGIWEFAPEAVQMWNTMPSLFTLGLQGLILVVIVIGGLAIFLRFLRSLSNEAVTTNEN